MLKNDRKCKAISIDPKIYLAPQGLIYFANNIAYWQTFLPKNIIEISSVTSPFPLTKACDRELCCFLWSAPEQMVEQTIKIPVIWDAIALIMT